MTEVLSDLRAFKLATGAHHFASATIEIADRCNEVCVHCYQIQGQKGEMDTAQVCAVIDRLADAGVLWLTLSGGEATLRRDFRDIVAHARSRHFAVRLMSNGLRIDDNLADFLAEQAIASVQISLYAMTPEVHDRTTGVPGSFAKTTAAIRRLRARNIAVDVAMTVMQHNVDDVAPLLAFTAEVGARPSISGHVFAKEDGDRQTEALNLDQDRYARFFADLQAAAEQQSEKKAPDEAPPPAPNPLHGRPCQVGKASVHVEANGEVRGCALFTHTFGKVDAGKGPIEVMRESDDAAILGGLTWGHIVGCRVCDLRPHCHRCFANAQDEAGDALAPYASACARALTVYAHKTGALAWESPPGDNPVGPFREVASGILARTEDALSAEDIALRERAPWLRPARHRAAPAGSPAAARANEGFVPATRLARTANVSSEPPA